MLYWRVLPEFDNFPLAKRTLIGNELITDAEAKKLSVTHVLTPEEVNRCMPIFADRVEISKRQVYWMFGARFANHDAKITTIAWEVK